MQTNQNLGILTVAQCYFWPDRNTTETYVLAYCVNISKCSVSVHVPGRGRRSTAADGGMRDYGS